MIATMNTSSTLMNMIVMKTMKTMAAMMTTRTVNLMAWEVKEVIVGTRKVTLRSKKTSKIQPISMFILPQPATRSVPSSKTNPKDGNIDGLDYDRIADSMILLKQGDNAKEEWNNSFGNKDAKRLLHTAMRLDPIRENTRVNNIVLFGPPGTGKSMMWKAAS